MTGRLSSICLVAILVGCTHATHETEDSGQTNSGDTAEVVPATCDQSHLNSCKMIDTSLCHDGVCLVCHDPKSHSQIVVSDSEGEYEVLSYEGLLMAAFSVPEGYRLKFSPYSYFDDRLEQEVPSEYTEDFLITVSPQQEIKLGFFEHNPATNNLKWDYHENLFTVYYYEKPNGLIVPLNFIDQGKQTWDG